MVQTKKGRPMTRLLLLYPAPLALQDLLRHLRDSRGRIKRTTSQSSRAPVHKGADKAENMQLIPKHSPKERNELRQCRSLSWRILKVLRGNRGLTKIWLFVALLVLTNSCGIFPGLREQFGPLLPQQAEEDQSTPQEALNRKEAIEKYLTGRDLSPIEGVWIWPDNSYEVIITRNSMEAFPEYDYVGLITDTQNDRWNMGDVKFLLKESASQEIYTGTFYLGDKSTFGTSFVLRDPNIIETSIPSRRPGQWVYGPPESLLLVRVYPKGQGTAKAKGGGGSSGTGFFVSDEVVATNYHVVADAKAITVDLGGTPINADLLLKDVSNDLALLRVIREADSVRGPTQLRQGTRCLVLGQPSTVQSGASVYVLGFPLSGLLGSHISVSSGIVNNTLGLNDDPRMFQISVPIQPGNSGSPLLDSQGRVVGVVTLTLNNKYLLATQGTLPQNVNFAIKSSYLQSLLGLLPETGCAAPALPSGRALAAAEIQTKFSSAIVRIKASE